MLLTLIMTLYFLVNRKVNLPYSTIGLWYQTWRNSKCFGQPPPGLFQVDERTRLDLTTGILQAEHMLYIKHDWTIDVASSCLIHISTWSKTLWSFLIWFCWKQNLLRIALPCNLSSTFTYPRMEGMDHLNRHCLSPWAQYQKFTWNT